VTPEKEASTGGEEAFFSHTSALAMALALALALVLKLAHALC